MVSAAAPRSYTLVFSDPLAALRFVERLVLNLGGDLAIFRDGDCVVVLDAAARDRGGRIAELARSSSASSIRQVDLKKTQSF